MQTRDHLALARLLTGSDFDNNDCNSKDRSGNDCNRKDRYGNDCAYIDNGSGDCNRRISGGDGLRFDSIICEKAFILGNIAPDYELTSYLRGIFTAPRFHSHSDENTRDFVCCSLNDLRAKDGLTPYDCFMLGAALHCLADSFTYPHTRAFTGTLWVHLRYERLLHTVFGEYISSAHRFDGGDTGAPRDSSGVADISLEIARRHEVYEEATPSPDGDSAAIISACRSLLGAVLSGRRCAAGTALPSGGRA